MSGTQNLSIICIASFKNPDFGRIRWEHIQTFWLQQQKMILTEDFHSKQQNIPKWRARGVRICLPSLPEERFAALSCSQAAGKGLGWGFSCLGEMKTQH